MIHTFPEVASPYYKQRLLCCHYLKHPLVEPALRVYLGHGNFPMGACLRLNFGKLPAKSYNCFVACVQKTKQSKGTHNSFKVTHSEVLLSQKKKGLFTFKVDLGFGRLLNFPVSRKNCQIFHNFQSEKSAILHMITKGLFEFGS